MIPKIRSVQEEPKQDSASNFRKNTEFAKYLDQAVQKECEASKNYCETTFYGSDRMLKDFHYQPREYSY